MAANVSCMSSMHAYLSIYVCVYVYVKSHLNFAKFSMHMLFVPLIRFSSDGGLIFSTSGFVNGIMHIMARCK